MNEICFVSNFWCYQQYWNKHSVYYIHVHVYYICTYMSYIYIFCVCMYVYIYVYKVIENYIASTIYHELGGLKCIFSPCGHWDRKPYNGLTVSAGGCRRETTLLSFSQFASLPWLMAPSFLISLQSLLPPPAFPTPPFYKDTCLSLITSAKLLIQCKVYLYYCILTLVPYTM